MGGDLLDKLLTVVELFQRDMARAFAGTPLTPARVAVLWILQTRGPSTQQAVAEALKVTPRNISALVDALEAARYVRRTKHPTDRRAFVLRLTPQAEELMTTMRQDHDRLTADLLAAVSPADVPALERGIDAIIGRLTQLTATAQGEHPQQPETTR